MAQLRAEAAQVADAARNWREQPMRRVALVAAFGAECWAWFALGEIVGRGGSILGYDY